MTKVTLLNGFEIAKDEDGRFPPLQEVFEIYHACDICPLRPMCGDNNEFGCQVDGMFSSFYMSGIDAIEYMKKRNEVTPRRKK